MAAAGALVVVGSAALHAEPEDRVGLVTLSGELQLAQLVGLAAQRSGVSVEAAPGTLNGVVDLLGPRSLTDVQLWELAQRSLIARQLTTVQPPGDDAFLVVRLQDAASASRLWSSPDALLSAEPMPGFARVLIALDQPLAEIAFTELRAVLSGPGTSLNRTRNALLVVAPSSSIPSFLAVLNGLDGGPPAGSQIETLVIRVRNRDPADVADDASSYVADIETISGDRVPGRLSPGPDGRSLLLITSATHAELWQDAIGRFDVALPEVRRAYTVPSAMFEAAVRKAAQIAGDPVPGTDDRATGRASVIEDEEAGTITVTGTSDQHARFEEAIGALNARAASEYRTRQTFRISNRDAADLAAVIGSTLESRPADPVAVPGTDDAVRPVRVPAEPSQVGAAFAEPVRITTDDATNTLIVFGTPDELDAAAELVEMLDVRDAQVMLDVFIVSLTDGQTRDLGVEIEEISVSGETTIRLASLFGLGGAGEGASALSGSGFTGSILRPGDFSIVVRALETVSDGRSVSKPGILVNNNAQATLDAVLQQPFTSTNASDTVATTSFGGTQDAGTTLSVTPRIAEGDHIVLDYSVSLSSFVGESSSPGVPPPRQQNQVQSSVTIPDGYTVVVGGLELTTEGDSVTKVPLLGDIPLLGAAFRNRSESASRAQFYVFIRANVLRSNGFEDLRHLTDVAYEEVGEYGGWPTVEPRLIR